MAADDSDPIVFQNRLIRPSFLETAVEGYLESLEDSSLAPSAVHLATLGTPILTPTMGNPCPFKPESGILGEAPDDLLEGSINVAGNHCSGHSIPHSGPPDRIQKESSLGFFHENRHAGLVPHFAQG